MMFYSAEVNGNQQQQRINLSQDLCDEILFLRENTHSGRPKKKYWLPARRIRKRVCVSVIYAERAQRKCLNRV